MRTKKTFNFGRHQRIVSVIRSELNNLMLKSYDFQGVSFTEVNLDSDCSIAKIYVQNNIANFSKSDEKKVSMESVVQGLNSKSGFYRAHLGKVMKIKRVPKIIFIVDDKLVQSENLVNLINSLD